MDESPCGTASGSKLRYLILRTTIPWTLPSKELIKQGVDKCVAFCKNDCDAYETSWDFAVNPLVAIASNPVNPVNPVEKLYADLREKWARDCEEMRRLEKENNRIFIEAYGLQDELTPEVPWHEITLTCNPWYRYGVKAEDRLPPLTQRTQSAQSDAENLDRIENGEASLEKPLRTSANSAFFASAPAGSQNPVNPVNPVENCRNRWLKPALQAQLFSAILQPVARKSLPVRPTQRVLQWLMAGGED